MVDLDVLAKGLTEAQRRALINAVGDDSLRVTRWRDGRSVMALHRKGLTNAPPRIGSNDGLIAVLTPLGHALRAHLKDIQDG